MVINNIGRAVKRALDDVVQLRAEGTEMNTRTAEKVDASMAKIRKTV